jgi:hypothetical protein
MPTRSSPGADSSEIGGQFTEIVAYGTAVVRLAS